MTGEQWLAMLGRRDHTDAGWELMSHGALAMDEAEWRACPFPIVLLRLIWGRVSVRKRTLYLCGGCRHQTHFPYDESNLRLLEVAERSADGLATESEIQLAYYESEGDSFGGYYEREFWDEVTVGRREGIEELVRAGIVAESALTGGDWVVDWDRAERHHQALCLLHEPFWVPSQDTMAPHGYQRLNHPDWPGRWLADCIFGNPFRPVVADPAWLTPTAVSIGASLYEERAFDRLPMLADALEEAGCTNADVLLHCRAPGEHVRGCWVVDLVLGKE